MSLGDRVRALLALRDSLPDLLGARWHDDGEAVTERFTRLEAATTEPEQEAAIDALVVSLMRFPGARAALRRALEAGDPAPPVDRLSFEDSPPSAPAPAGSAPAAPPTPPVPAGSAVRGTAGRAQTSPRTLAAHGYRRGRTDRSVRRVRPPRVREYHRPTLGRDGVRARASQPPGD